MNTLKRILIDEEAATAVEYAVMLGMILGTILGSIGVVGQQAGGLWSDIQTDLDDTAW